MHNDLFFPTGCHVEHDTIFITASINNTPMLQFNNAIRRLVKMKIAQAKTLSTYKAQHSPRIHLVFDCPDTKDYPEKTCCLFRQIEIAKQHNIIIETTVIGNVSGWTSELAAQHATLGFRNMYQDATYSYYELIDYKNKRNVYATELSFMSAEQCLENGLCDNLFLNNGNIKTR